jgi:molybdopterin converting factor small subunit
MMGRVKIKQLGEKEFLELPLVEGREDLNSLLLWLSKNSPYNYFWEGSVIIVNREVASRNVHLKDGDEILIFPPLEGG